jgi:putative flippase GtrA
LRWLSPAQKRIAVFGAVGATCFATQLVLLAVMARLGMYRPLANAVAFEMSAQLNFLLSSRLTWRDRPSARRRGTGARWLAYNGTALLSLGCNTVVFTLAYKAIGSVPAAAAGVVVGTCLVYLICNFLIFRASGPADGTRQAAEPVALDRTVVS